MANVNYARKMNVKEYGENYLYNSTVIYRTETLARFCCILELFSYSFVSVLNYVLQCFVAAFSISVVRRIREFKDLLYDINLKAEVLVDEHNALYRDVTLLDDVAGVLYIAWQIEWISSFALSLPALISTDFSLAPFKMLFWTLDVVAPLVMSLIVSFSLSDVTTVQSELDCALTIRTAKLEDHCEYEAYFRIKINTASFHVCCLNSFIINKTFILNLYGTLTTYMLFIVHEVHARSNL